MRGGKQVNRLQARKGTRLPIKRVCNRAVNLVMIIIEQSLTLRQDHRGKRQKFDPQEHLLKAFIRKSAPSSAAAQ